MQIDIAVYKLEVLLAVGDLWMLIIIVIPEIADAYIFNQFRVHYTLC